MGELLKTAVESPLSIALVICAALAGVLYRLLPLIAAERAEKRERESGRFDATFRRRMEEHARRVHDMAGTFGEARRMLARFDQLEMRVEQVKSDMNTFARDVAEIRAIWHTQAARLDDVCERFDRVEQKLDRLIERLLGPTRGQ